MNLRHLSATGLMGWLLVASIAFAEAPPKLSDLDFMLGQWQGSAEMGGPEELWLPAVGGVMTGVFRWPSAGGRYVLELLTIAEEVDGVIFRFKHFDPDITPWEKDAANTYRLAEVVRDCATFAGVETSAQVPATIQYCRTNDTTLVFRGATAGQAVTDAGFTLEYQRVESDESVQRQGG